MNETILKFGYPQTLLKDFKYWVVLLRPLQVTAGSMILAYKENAESLAEVTPEAYQELTIVTYEIEQTLKVAFNMLKINYLALMMVDKQVHFHVIPRYSSIRKLNNIIFNDNNWPKPPNVLLAHNLSANDLNELKTHLLNCWK